GHQGGQRPRRAGDLHAVGRLRAEEGEADRHGPARDPEGRPPVAVVDEEVLRQQAVLGRQRRPAPPGKTADRLADPGPVIAAVAASGFARSGTRQSSVFLKSGDFSYQHPDRRCEHLAPCRAYRIQDNASSFPSSHPFFDGGISWSSCEDWPSWGSFWPWSA